MGVVGDDDSPSIAILLGYLDPKAEREPVACLRSAAAIRWRCDQDDGVDGVSLSQIEVDPVHRVLRLGIAAVMSESSGGLTSRRRRQSLQFVAQRLFLGIQLPHLRAQEAVNHPARGRCHAWVQPRLSRRDDDGEPNKHCGPMS